MNSGIWRKTGILILIFTIARIILGWMWWCIPFLFIHEMCHCLIGILLGYSIDRIKILPFGLNAVFIEEFVKPGDDIIISLSGPLINFAFYIFFSIPAINKNEELNFIREVNLFLFLFNLIPVGFLDGGRIFKSIIKMYFNFYYCYLLSNLSGTIFGCIISLIALIKMDSYRHIILLGLGIYFIYTGYTGQNELIINIIKDVLFKHSYISERKKLTINLRAYSKETRLIDIIKAFNYSSYDVIYVIEDGLLKRKFNETDIIYKYCKYGNISIYDSIRKTDTQEVNYEDYR